MVKGQTLTQALLSRAGGGGRMRKLSGGDHIRQVAYQLLLWARQAPLGKN